VKVFDDQDRGPAGGERDQEPPPRRLGLFRPQLGPGQAHQRPDRVAEARRLAGTDQFAQRLVEPGAGGLRRVGVEDRGVRLDDVGQRGVRDVLAERRAAAGVPNDRHGGHDALAVLVKLADQAALADTGVAEHGDHLRRAVADRPIQRVDQQRQFVGAVDQRGGADLAVGMVALHRLDGQPHLGGLAAPAQRHRWLGSVADGVLRRGIGRTAHEDAARWRHRL
jgi:hypothetical protein